MQGQLLSGGWDYEIEFDPVARAGRAYRVSPNNPKGKNVTTLDDNTTQAALRLLMRLDRALVAKGQADPAVREAVDYALKSLLGGEYSQWGLAAAFQRAPRGGELPRSATQLSENLGTNVAQHEIQRLLHIQRQRSGGRD